MAIYQKATWIEMLQAKLGTHIGTDNARFSPDLCDAALRQSIRMWQPLMPVDFQDNSTETIIDITWNSGQPDLLPGEVARLMGVEISGYTVELYGIGRKGMDYNAWVANKQARTNLANGRVYLVCYYGKTLLIHPANTGALTGQALVRVYPTWPTATTSPIYVPETTIPFHLAQAAALGKWGDLRGSEAQALQAEALSMLKMVYATQDREEEKS